LPGEFGHFIQPALTLVAGMAGLYPLYFPQPCLQRAKTAPKRDPRRAFCGSFYRFDRGSLDDRARCRSRLGSNHHRVNPGYLSNLPGRKRCKGRLPDFCSASQPAGAARVHGAGMHSRRCQPALEPIQYQCMASHKWSGLSPGCPNSPGNRAGNLLLCKTDAIPPTDRLPALQFVFCALGCNPPGSAPACCQPAGLGVPDQPA